MNSRIFAALVAIVVVVIAALFYFVDRQYPEKPKVPPIATATPGPQSDGPAYNPETAPSLPGKTARLPAEAKATPPTPPAAMTEADRKIDEILRLNVDTAQTAQMLINLLPSLAEGQSDAAQHISNLLEDKDYAKVMPLIKNPSLPEEVLDVFVTDLMNREDTVKLPTLLEIAKIPNHPHHEEAVTDLQIFLDEDFGADWPKWEGAMKKYLAEQAAEEAGIPAIGAPQPVPQQ